MNYSGLVVVLAILFVCLDNVISVVSEDASCNLKDEQLILELPNGKIRGKFNGAFYSYESIPYALPPVGELRFEAPLPYTTEWEGIRDATKKPVSCMQWDQFKDEEGGDMLHGAEDCLNINIYKPLIAKNATLPVLIFIHGGAFMFGSPEDYNHELLMHRKSFIVVKMSYRLGPLGFLSTEDEVIPGNYGLKDQRLALQWIKTNIALFGGQPNQMVVIGFSAGAASLHLHMLHKDFSQYAKAAVSFSGTAFNPWVIQRDSRVRAFELAAHLNCTTVVANSDEIKQCLKSKQGEDIVRGVRKFLVFGYNPFTTFGPVVEAPHTKNAFLIQTPESIIRSGQLAQVPWLVTYAAQDGGYNSAELIQIPQNKDGFLLMDELKGGWFDIAPEALFLRNTILSTEEMNKLLMSLREEYLGNQTFSLESYQDILRMYTDILFKNGVETALMLHRKYSKEPVYAYVYDNPPTISVASILAKRSDIQFGSSHGDDFYLIFRNPFGLPVLDAVSQNISNNLIKMLEDFVAKSDVLKFGNCNFVNNANEDYIQLLRIKRDGCENLSIEGLP